jgi:hypothetical protein
MSIKTIAIYPGRFQPMGKHHYKTYQWACKKYGEENVFITTSNKIQEGRSPLSFIQKSNIMNAHGVPFHQIVQAKNPYAPKELFESKDIDLKSVRLVVIVGEKDMESNPRFSNLGMTKSTKRNPVPRPTYFQALNESSDNTAEIHGYIDVAPHVSYKLPNGKESSGTNIREFIKESNTQEAIQALGFYDKCLFENLKKKNYNLTEKFSTLEQNTTEYSSHLEEILSELEEIKQSFNYRKKSGRRYRKEAGMIQNAISTIRKLKRTNDKKLMSENIKFDSEELKKYYSKFIK